MQLVKTHFRDLFIIQPRVFADERGYFLETYNKEAFTRQGLQIDFVQDNQSGSVANVIRGLHFQLPPHAQGKLVRVISGSVLDVALDLRKGEPTFGHHFKMHLSAADNQMIYIPGGFAHGFKTLEDNTVFAYKCTHHYVREAERTIQWNDPVLGIDWESDNPILSEKDKTGLAFDDFNSPF